MTDDETLVVRLLSAHAPAAALGRLPTALFAQLAMGSPLLSLAGAGAPYPGWRQLYPPQPGSLYEQLEFIRAFTPAPERQRTLYHEMLERRSGYEMDRTGPMLES
jgi:hypothetical protein